jgi:hypothetical protein
VAESAGLAEVDAVLADAPAAAEAAVVDVVVLGVDGDGDAAGVDPVAAALLDGSFGVVPASTAGVEGPAPVAVVS